MKKPSPNARGKAIERAIRKYGAPGELYIDNGREFLYKEKVCPNPQTFEASRMEEEYSVLKELHELRNELHELRNEFDELRNELREEIASMEEKHSAPNEFDELLKEQIRLLADWNKSYIYSDPEQARKNTKTILAFWKEFCF
jgi:predicted RNase H-like nuclease (RuvC/YqgF family)